MLQSSNENQQEQQQQQQQQNIVSWNAQPSRGASEGDERKKTLQSRMAQLQVTTTATATATKENSAPEQNRNETEINISDTKQLSKSARLRKKKKAAIFNKYVAMDCEMVGIGQNGQLDMLGRVSIVNKGGEVLLDKYVKPQETVIDYRTDISGIRPLDMENGEDFDTVQDEVLDILQGKILVGHDIRHDLAVLRIKHPYVNIRDTSRYKPLCRLVANGHTPSLKRLSQAVLGIEIQTGEHNSVEDARATMCIYNCLSKDWEMYIQEHDHHRQHHHHRHHHSHN